MKEYMKPVLREQNIKVNEMMIATSPQPGLNDNPASGNKPVLGNGRRGTWGNLWYDDEVEE